MKKALGYLSLIVLTVGVLLFLGKHSLNFFMFTFQGQDELFAWVGLLLTSVGAIAWLVVFKWLAGSNIQKLAALSMMVVALIGEFVTASFDIYMNGLQAGSFEFAPDEIKIMSYVVALLGLLAGIALVAYTAGDSIIEAFKDDDGDGTRNIFDPDYKPEHAGTEKISRENGQAKDFTSRQRQK